MPASTGGSGSADTIARDAASANTAAITAEATARATAIAAEATERGNAITAEAVERITKIEEEKRRRIKADNAQAPFGGVEFDGSGWGLFSGYTIGTSDFSFIARVRNKSLGLYGFCLSMGRADADVRIGLGIEGEEDKYRFIVGMDGGSQVQLKSDITAEIGDEVLLVGVRAGNEIRIYVDDYKNTLSISELDQNLTNTAHGAISCIDLDSFPPASHFTGIVREAGILNRALTDSEVEEIRVSGFSAWVKSNALGNEEFNCLFNAGSGDILKDLSSHGRNVTLSATGANHSIPLTTLLQNTPPTIANALSVNSEADENAREETPVTIDPATGDIDQPAAAQLLEDGLAIPKNRAWCIFDGDLAGTNAPTAGQHVASVTRNSIGDYTVNLSISAPSVNFFTMSNCIDGASRLSTTNPQTVNTVSLKCFKAEDGTANDTGASFLAIW